MEGILQLPIKYQISSRSHLKAHRNQEVKLMKTVLMGNVAMDLWISNLKKVHREDSSRALKEGNPLLRRAQMHEKEMDMITKSQGRLISWIINQLEETRTAHRSYPEGINTKKSSKFLHNERRIPRAQTASAWMLLRMSCAAPTLYMPWMMTTVVSIAMNLLILNSNYWC